MSSAPLHQVPSSAKSSPTGWCRLASKNVVIILENTDYGHPAAAAERAHLERAGVHVEQLEIELGTEDFVPILSRLYGRPELPDAIRILVSGETSYNLTQQMAELGIAPTDRIHDLRYQSPRLPIGTILEYRSRRQLLRL